MIVCHRGSRRHLPRVRARPGWWCRNGEVVVDDWSSRETVTGCAAEGSTPGVEGAGEAAGDAVESPAAHPERRVNAVVCRHAALAGATGTACRVDRQGLVRPGRTCRQEFRQGQATSLRA
jgi:hypothetical protein